MKELSIDQFIDLVYNKCANYTGVKFSTETERFESASDLIQMLIKNYPEKYANEIVGSYHLADKKKFYEEDSKTLVVLFRTIDYRQCSDLLYHFDQYFKKTFSEELKSQRFWFKPEPQKVFNEDEVFQSFTKNLLQALEIVSSGKYYDLAFISVSVYDKLANLGIIQVSEERLETEKAASAIRLKSRYRAESYAQGIQLGAKINLQKLAEDLLPDNIRVINEVKEWILNSYLKEWSGKKLTVDEILKLKK